MKRTLVLITAILVAPLSATGQAIDFGNNPADPCRLIPDQDVVSGEVYYSSNSEVWYVAIGDTCWKTDRRSGDTVTETPYVNGQIHGTRKTRGPGLWVRTPFVNGVRHGTQISRVGDGYVEVTPYVNGEKHGTVIWIWPDGTVHEFVYVNGEQQDWTE